MVDFGVVRGKWLAARNAGPLACRDILAACRDVRCHSSIKKIRAFLVCNDRDEHIFALTQSLDFYHFYQAKMVECDRKLEAAIAALKITTTTPIGLLPKALAAP